MIMKMPKTYDNIKVDFFTEKQILAFKQIA